MMTMNSVSSICNNSRTIMAMVSTVLVLATTATAGTLLYYHNNKKKNEYDPTVEDSSHRTLSKHHLRNITSSNNSTYCLHNVNIPIAVLPKNVLEESAVKKNTNDNGYNSEESVVSNEGFIVCNVYIRNGQIGTIDLVRKQEQQRSYNNNNSNNLIDCYGCIMVPCFVDCHTHLIKTHTVSRTRNASGTMNEAWGECEVKDMKKYWKHPNDIYRRMDFAVQCAVYHGTFALRTHLDGCDNDDIEIQSAVYDAYIRIQTKYKDVLQIQGVANLYLPLYCTQPEFARKHVIKAKSYSGVVLGAYVGNTSNTPIDETNQHFDALFQLANEFNMDIDLHIDESNDPECCALKPLIMSTKKARNNGYTGRVVLGHCCSLSLQDKTTQQYICTELGKLQDVYVVANPFTNLILQDRKGSKPPLCLEIPNDIPRTPQWRGLTLYQELRGSGVVVASASDNVRDFWCSYGSDYDMLSVWSMTQAIGHLDTEPNEGSWADIVTINPAKAMGILRDKNWDGGTIDDVNDDMDVIDPSSSLLSIGQTANMILFPNARRGSELFARPHNDRIIIRNGQILNTKLPNFAELDDSVSLE